jgi:L-rhamnose mutarotase
MADEYRRVHARIPTALHDALTESGLVKWRIWIDGDTLFHLIETREGRERMVAKMAERPPVDPAWDATINALMSDEPGSGLALHLVWDSSAN